MTSRVSLSSEAAEADLDSYAPSISARGRYVAFASRASNLVVGDTNGSDDAFVRDLTTGITQRVSVSSSGAEGDSNSDAVWGVTISADGRYVAFASSASNLVRADTNITSDVFVRDLKTGTTRRVSVSSQGKQGNGYSQHPWFSADGRYVAFDSDASNLVPGDTNRGFDVFVRDLKTGTTRRVSVSSQGTQGNGFSLWPSISADGRYVAFSSDSSNLVRGDTNRKYDVFVRDLKTGTTRRVSVSSHGAQGNGYSDRPSISADGRYVVFVAHASNLVPGDTNGSTDVFLRDRRTGTTQRVSLSSDGAQGDAGSDHPALSADGRHIAFTSDASNLVPGDTNGAYDVFVRDLATGTTELASVTNERAQGDADSISLNDFAPAISAHGEYVVFDSGATNLVSGDTNGCADLFLRGPLP